MMEEKQVTEDEEKLDVENNKGMGIIAYIIFFIPLLALEVCDRQ